MEKIKKHIFLSREAMLFDSPLYIMKSFISVLTAYVLFSGSSIVGKDMISVLFGMMLTLEPVNISGLKSGIAQVKASWIGGVTTAIIVALFGINWFTIPLAVAMTVYVTLVGNWKEISPVAIFTAIYMTQYVQFDAMGDPSVLLTLRLRLMALAAGICIAVFYNYVFSKFFYKKMIRKRIMYVLEKMDHFFKLYQTHDDFNTLNQLKNDAMSLFTDIDFIFNHLNDIRDSKQGAEHSHSITAISELKNMNHYFIEMVLYTINHLGLEPLKFDIESVILQHQNLIKVHLKGNHEFKEIQIKSDLDNYYINTLTATIIKIEKAIGSFSH